MLNKKEEKRLVAILEDTRFDSEEGIVRYTVGYTLGTVRWLALKLEEVNKEVMELKNRPKGKAVIAEKCNRDYCVVCRGETSAI